MSMPRTITQLALALGILVVGAVVPARALSLDGGGADAIVDHDGFSHGWPRIAVGDFNGDGVGDVALWLTGTSRGETHRDLAIVLGRRRAGRSLLSREPKYRVKLAGLEDVESLEFADVSGDGKDDLVLGSPTASTVYIILGRSVTRLGDITRADVVLTSTAAGDAFGAVLATGDFDGDGRQDVAVGAPSGPRGIVSIWKGRPVSTETVSASLIDGVEGVVRLPSSWATGKNFRLMKVRSTTDGRDDLLLSDVYAVGSQGGPQDAFLFRGGAWPRVWDLDVSSPSVVLRASSLLIAAAGDVTGDGVDDLQLINERGHYFFDGMNIGSNNIVYLGGPLPRPLQSLPLSGEDRKSVV
jgi:hypothetical protein